ncbi:SNF2 family domain-containing protein, partial [Colletotrichum musicola]
TPLRQDSSEKLPRAPPNKTFFHWNCDGDSDDEESPALQSFLKSTRQPVQEKDIIDDVLEDVMAESRDADTGAHESHEESCELFVSDDEERPERTPPSQNETNIKSEPDEDEFCMIIDSAQASSDAQSKWAKSLKFTIDLTGDNQDATETKKVIKADPVTVKIEQEDGTKPAPQNPPDQPSGLISETYESMNQRITDLKAKALNGQISGAELDELLRLQSRLVSMKGATEGSINSIGRSLSDDDNRPSGSQLKKWARKPAKTLAQRWAERRKKDQQKEANQKRKRCADEGRASSAKKAKQNVDSDDNSDHDDEGEPSDFILEREKLGELLPEPKINTRNKAEQLRMIEAAARSPEEFDKAHLNKQIKELQDATSAAFWGPRIVYAINDWPPTIKFELAFLQRRRLRDQMNKELADPEKYKEWLEEHTRDLHRIKWYRIVLDEAHEI